MKRTIRHIIAATDMSETANAAVARAGHFAKLLGARITLVHVFDPLPMGAATGYPGAFWPVMPDIGAMRDQLAKGLKRVRDTVLVDVADVECRTLEHHNASLAICGHAEEVDADLVVVGTHGRTGVSRLLIGSVAEVTIRHAPCSVLAVRDSNSDLPKHLLVATDMSPASRPALVAASDLAQATGAAVTVLVVFVRPPPFRGLRQEELEDTDTALRSELTELHAEYFEVPFELAFMRSDNAALAISEYAEEHGVDLVVIGTHGRTGIKRLLIGSVAEVTTRHAPCSVWTARG
jgi:nucleotide-binding universal stress UspA family protein